MTKKHFEAIAEILRDQLMLSDPNSDAAAAITQTALQVADVCKLANPRFDRARFLDAAGLRG